MKDNFSVYKWRREHLTEAANDELSKAFEKEFIITVWSHDTDEDGKFIKVKKRVSQLDIDKIKSFFKNNNKEYSGIDEYENSEGIFFTKIYYK